MAFQSKEPKSEWIQFCNFINKWLGHGSQLWYTLPTRSWTWDDRCKVQNFLGRKCLYAQAAFNQSFFTNFYSKYDVEYDLSILSIHSIRNCPWTHGFEYYIIPIIDFPLQWCKVIMQTMSLPCDGPVLALWCFFWHPYESIVTWPSDGFWQPCDCPVIFLWQPCDGWYDIFDLTFS